MIASFFETLSLAVLSDMSTFFLEYKNKPKETNQNRLHIQFELQKGNIQFINDSNSTIENFKLTNSYFEKVGATSGVSINGAENDGIGSIAGHAAATFKSIYSDAIVVSAARNPTRPPSTASRRSNGCAS